MTDGAQNEFQSVAFDEGSSKKPSYLNPDLSALSRYFSQLGIVYAKTRKKERQAVADNEQSHVDSEDLRDRQDKRSSAQNSLNDHIQKRFAKFDALKKSGQAVMIDGHYFDKADIEAEESRTNLHARNNGFVRQGRVVEIIYVPELPYDEEKDTCRLIAVPFHLFEGMTPEDAAALDKKMQKNTAKAWDKVASGTQGTPHARGQNRDQPTSHQYVQEAPRLVAPQ